MEMSISFRTKTSMTNIAHNNRQLTDEEFKEEAHRHIDRELSKDNIVIKQEDIHDVYEREFGSALKNYNAKQKRSDRQIKNYYHHVGHSKTLDRQREFVVTFGSKEDWDKLSRQDKIEAGEKLAEYLRDFEVRHPQLKVYNAIVHLDEKGAPHAHFNIVPVAKGYKKGLEKQPSFSKALAQEGIGGKSKFQFQDFRRQELVVLEKKLNELGLERKLVGTNAVKDMHEYKEMVSEVSNKRQELKELMDRANSLSESIRGLEGQKMALENDLVENNVKKTTRDVLNELESNILLDLGLEYTFRDFDLDKNHIKFGRHSMFDKQEYAFIPKLKWDKIQKLINDRPFVVAYNRFKDLTDKYVAKFKTEIRRLNSVIFEKNRQLEQKDTMLSEKDMQLNDLKDEVQEMIPYYNDSLINQEVLEELGYEGGFDDAIADLISLRFQDMEGNKLSFSEAKDYVTDMVKRKSKESGIKPPLRHYDRPNKNRDRGYQGPSL